MLCRRVSTYILHRYHTVCLHATRACDSTLQTNLERGLFQFTYGSRDSLVEFLHSDNFVQAHIKAAEAMAEDDSPVVSLESYTGMCEG